MMRLDLVIASNFTYALFMIALVGMPTGIICAQEEPNTADESKSVLVESNEESKATEKSDSSSTPEKTAEKTAEKTPVEQEEQPAPVIIVSGSDTSSTDSTPSFKASSFQGITPGKSTVEELTTALGEPAATLDTDDTTVSVYKIEPYERVGFILRSGIVDSIYIQLLQPVRVEQFAKELGLDQSQAISNVSDDGSQIELLWPDQGIAMELAKPDEATVATRILFNQIDAKGFLLRGNHLQWKNYSGSLSDARAAQHLVPNQTAAYVLEANVLIRMGLAEQAQLALEKAQEITPDAVDCLLLKARIPGSIKYPSEFIQTIRQIRNNARLDDLTRAEAAFAMGELFLQMQPQDFRQATVLHSEAIQRAKKASESDDLWTRLEAVRLMIDSHLAVAKDISHGDWSDKQKLSTVPKWVNIAWSLTEHLVKNDYHDPMLALHVVHRSLDALTNITAAPELATWVERADNEAQALLENHKDSDMVDRIRYEWGMALFHATACARKTNEPADTIKLGERAHSVLKARPEGDVSQLRWETPAANAALAKLYFLLGNTQAIELTDHDSAIKWYLLSLAHLEVDGVRERVGNLWFGERLVSIGLSYWQTGNKGEGIKLTKLGVRWIEESVDKNGTARQNLKIPYSNLAVMYKALGDTSLAEKITKQAEAIIIK